MGGISGSLYLSMLNGTETQSLGKSSDLSGHFHRGAKDLSDFKMGIQDARLYYPDPVPVPGAQDALALQFHPEQAPHSGRFYAQSLGNCPYGGVRSGTGQGYITASGDVFPTGGKDMYAPPMDGYPPTATTGFQHGYQRPQLYPLPGLQVCGKTQALLNNYPLWAKFHKFQTEMIITKQGRRMFPFLSFNLSVLDPSAHYNVYVDVVLSDQHHWRYQGGKWVQCGKAEGNMPGNRVYMHPDSPNTGAHWMRQEVSFSKLKLTNNKGSTNNVAQMVVLQSLHKYQPRLHIVEVKEDGSDDPFLSSKTQTFIFPETQFIAVTAYQNADITQLKIDHNPFAKGFRDNYDTLYTAPDPDRLTPSPTEAQPVLPGSCCPQGFFSEPFMSPLPQSRFYSREQHKDASASPGPPTRWYLPPQQGISSNRLDFPSTYEGDFSGNGFYKSFPLQTPAHHTFSYYQEHPFSSASMTGVSGAGWSTSRPPPQYLPTKPAASLGWFRPISTSSSSSSSSTSPGTHRLPPAPLQHKDSVGGAAEDPWPEPPSLKTADSAESGLFEGDNKLRRLSPYTDSTENSPHAGEVCKKDSDLDYYEYYTH
ncbi:T-box transcription factor TBX21 [Gouania willdenowi]|uniref:T-box domain-containing protein n=1 Tax=Gouania willdenowi TaxID=441366 RepID=A0A8C5HPI9_GOUWI|nr:T-box transcription factor TBX21 [Gouania willdenowi]